MDFINELRQFATRAYQIKSAITTEEGTKNSLVLPFFQMLGYDIFNPLEFVPEYAADFGVKKDARVDYAIMVDGNPIILIECKPYNENLAKHKGQLFQYYAATPAKFGILTNGITYKFFTDLNAPNKMDSEPFLIFDVLDIDEHLIPELKRFAKQTLDIEAAFNAASELKYTRKIKDVLQTMREEPSDNFVKYMLTEIYEGAKTQKVIDEFREPIKQAFDQYINDIINERLQSAIRSASSADNLIVEVSENEPAEEIIEKQSYGDRDATLEELEAFAIVKSILWNMCDVNRLSYKHTRDYTVVLFDNNSSKRICRFWFDKKQKYITTPHPDDSKKMVRHDIEKLNDIYKHSDFVKEVCSRYL